MTLYKNIFRLLEAIKTDVIKLKARKSVAKFFRASSIAGRLSEHTEALSSAWRSFDVRNRLHLLFLYLLTRSLQACCMLSIDRKLNEHFRLTQDQVCWLYSLLVVERLTWLNRENVTKIWFVINTFGDIALNCLSSIEYFDHGSSSPSRPVTASFLMMGIQIDQCWRNGTTGL